MPNIEVYQNAAWVQGLAKCQWISQHPPPGWTRYEGPAAKPLGANSAATTGRYHLTWGPKAEARAIRGSVVLTITPPSVARHVDRRFGRDVHIRCRHRA